MQRHKWMDMYRYIARSLGLAGTLHWLRDVHADQETVGMKRQSPKTLRIKLDAAFSKFIRARDTDPESGKGWCITCGVFSELECGHFIPRQYTATRWDDRNSHGQCSRCNRWLHGDQASYYVALVQKYGQGVVNELMALKRVTRKYTLYELRELIERYREKDEALER